MKLHLQRENIILGVAGLLIGISAALAYAIFRALTHDGGRWSTFSDNLLFPGLLVIAAVTVIVWLGWKANIDG